MTTTTSDRGWMTLRAAAAEFDVSVRSIRRRITAGRLRVEHDEQGRTLVERGDLAAAYAWKTVAAGLLAEQAREHGGVLR